MDRFYDWNVFPWCLEHGQSPKWVMATTATSILLLLIGLRFAFRCMTPSPLDAKPTADTSGQTPLDKIEPLINFSWSAQEPLRLRTFKPKYHITMGIEQMKLSDWIQIDKHYKNRIDLRCQLLQSNRDQVLRALPSAHGTISKLYAFMVNAYLPTRYSDVFKIIPESRSQASHLLNLVTKDKIPLHPTATSSSMLEAIGRQVEEDFLILQHDAESDEFQLTAFVACFPNGFDWAQKFGKNMSQIHVPVPDYDVKLKKSMNRFLQRMAPGQFVKRHNWSISTSGNLFSVANVHLYAGDKVEAEEVDFEKACLRCERQVLHRLQDSDDVILTIRTYMYPLREIKAEGSGPALADAIDGLQTGSSPNMYFYKRAPNWSDAVKRFLRDEVVETP
ncbi:hypothetical protein PFICI_02273 [Pestalotiopsis fici W106-1]|uniref:Uncharacterized protein n=1 Tax=Pestalotiopsis fici (strain W106-1 / CGMCC3.15140) TaxID=1229662 RepID=W3XDU8_PESFW|nr:uncharacterized protein PFICI_02273 [Pestalotiopsis fici W106-1]ETS84248.1 hypothetical protein PFICI_02273 [Pestalotiopsis fici W106-1]